jgi:hypothetical protein
MELLPLGIVEAGDAGVAVYWLPGGPFFGALGLVAAHKRFNDFGVRQIHSACPSGGLRFDQAVDYRAVELEGCAKLADFFCQLAHCKVVGVGSISQRLSRGPANLREWALGEVIISAPFRAFILYGIILETPKNNP